MSYEKINPIRQLNFQINRILTYGEAAADINAVREKAAKIRTFDEWQNVWNDMGKLAEQKSEFLRAAYCCRMAEFFLQEDDTQKDYLQIGNHLIAINYIIDWLDKYKGNR